jgi:hypothetical protein
MSSLSLLAVPWPKLGLLLLSFFAGEGPSAACLSRLSRTSFAFFESLVVVAAAAAAVVVVVVTAAVVFVVVVIVVATAVTIAVVFVAVFVVVFVVVAAVVAVVQVVAVAVFKLQVVTVVAEVTATGTGFESLLAHFRFLDRETSDVAVAGNFATGLSD